MKSAQTPTDCENVTIALTIEEHALIMWGLECLPCNTRDSVFVNNLRNKLQFLLPNIGGACRHSAHIPEAPVQVGNQ